MTDKNPYDELSSSSALPPRFSSPEDAANWIETSISDVLAARIAIDLALAAIQTKKVTPAQVKQAERVYLFRWGAAIGLIAACYRTGFLSDVGFTTFLTKVNATAKRKKGEALSLV